ncbi:MULTISPECIES: GNAT family N-acetyltransferase [Pseudomonas]|uniref:GNAT family N-acetyltransferase n=1 Tax=Pseudomonas shirazica TaxID=1940636 RepID=A0ABY9SUW6_9PSED|nr:MULTISPECIES: GNAT family N-acetyltransferase [Pseudomonas]MBO2921335.1 GNAT family N-acetyltransferase [Pseudomonas asiatica]WMY87392.1 GNAT family N-acetyltransferase [Pseudomonas shirazica]WPU58766.1 GNAT family N-acetyltransferase [Pseudomonas asiatica]
MDSISLLPKLLVRKPVSDDAAAIAILHIRSWQSAYEGLLSKRYLSSWDTSVERRVVFLKKAIESDSPSIRVAELDGQVVGWVSFGPSRDQDAPTGTAELMAIYLDPAFWACGIGTALWAEARQALMGHGYQQVCAWVLDGNERATRFYCKHGFSAQAGSQRIFEKSGESLPLTRYGLMLDS